MQRTRSTMLSVGLVGLLALAGTSFGQNALGDGRALDRNLQRGSGGVNTKVRDLDAQIKLNNAIVTGNAAYGRSFRGNAGYLATDEFRAGLGSNDLFKENLISAGSASLGGAATIGGSGIFNSSSPSDPSSVRFTQRGIRGTDALRYQMALTTGNANPADAGDAPVAIRRAGAGASGRTIGNAIRSTSEFRAQRSIQPTVLGTTIVNGDSYALLASPLMGVKVRGVEASTDSSGTNEPEKWRPTGMETQARLARERQDGQDEAKRKSPDAVSTKVDTEVGGVSGVLDRYRAESEARSGVNGAVDTRARPDGSDLTKAPGGKTPDGKSPEFKPGDRSVPVDPTANPGDPTKQVLPGDKPAPGASDQAPQPAWLESLEDMRRSLRGEPTKREIERAAKKPEGAKPGADNADPTKPDTGKPDIGKPGERQPVDLSKPFLATTPEQRKAVLDARIKAILDAQGFDPGKDAFNVEQIEATKKARMKVNTMIAGQPASVYYLDRMTEGEKALKAERYFDAEDAFSRAMGAMPMDALAQAGRVHSQIGAGLYMSAAANLRDLFATRPEMIGVKYDTSVLPAPERLKTIREQLAKTASKPEAALSGDAGLLQAYLAYQAGDMPGVDAGLKTFSTKIQPDNAADLALLELAAKIWKAPVPADLPVLEKPAPAPAPAPKPAGPGSIDFNK